jgi:hypothetical protein
MPPGIQIHTQRTAPGDVSSAVRNLLLSTKQLQDALTQWSNGLATETQVSDVYVQIGTQFNTTIHAFAYHKIDLRYASHTQQLSFSATYNPPPSDIHSIPKELRSVLEQCLAEDPSPQTLSVFMPEVRQILYKLLRGLQVRQDAWRAVAGQSSY